jgi:hypothetical protein
LAKAKASVEREFYRSFAPIKDDNKIILIKGNKNGKSISKSKTKKV